MARLSFYGAAGEVTGSCYLVETDRARVLVDFGLHQGDDDSDRRNRTPPPIDPARLDAVALTHAHLDHCGRLPLLERSGFKGWIYATAPSCDLAGIILRDAAAIQEGDAAEGNRRRLRRGRQPVPPLYTSSEAEAILTRLVPVQYNEPREIAPGISVRCVEAGHIIGSASIEMVIAEGGRTKTVAFSGDVGPAGAPILRDASTLSHADVLVLESTYGDRDHRPLEATIAELESIMRRAQAEGAKVLIPAFAVGRTQDVIFHLAGLIRAGRIEKTRVYVDSPMAAAASDLYHNHPEIYDRHAADMLRRGEHPIEFPGLHYVGSRQESQSLNRLDCCAVIIAGSGMCTGGRILHHLKHGLWRPETHVIFVGYQAEGTLGRQLVDGARRVRVMGEEIAVKARIHTLGGLSAHAGQSGLLAWAQAAAGSRPRVYLTHGEDRPRAALREKLAERTGLLAELPAWGDTMEF